MRRRGYRCRACRRRPDNVTMTTTISHVNGKGLVLLNGACLLQLKGERLFLIKGGCLLVIMGGCKKTILNKICVILVPLNYRHL